ncbi:Helix-loop-helix DNA-binding domain protein [Teladorsagia circumcincta]|uniref:Helix-loop-helix DNA-binding domain protein n=1 Tax=Teladorsagia circumcincta TaxID=45464 RepID=A0A2G9UJ70_TELCI|nr:Helix-loop-helix DNA-binding domain protein [Teladorsagia circumcincta]
MDAQDNVAMDTSWAGHEPQPQTSGGPFPYAKPVHRPNQHSPPQDYYDPNRNREIGSIVSLLQSHSPPSSDPYAAMKFSPPNFDSSLNGGGPASMLPKLGPPTVPPLQLNHYQNGSLPLPDLHLKVGTLLRLTHAEARERPKTERRTAHNLIEKKYRCSINDRIQHLKTILAGDDAKLSKSATLRKAIEHIGRLEAENQDLRLEVQRLVSVLHSHNIETHYNWTDLKVIPPAPAILMGSPTLSPSTSSASIQSPGTATSPRTSPTLPLKGAKRPRTSMEQGRVTIFAIMFAMLMWNPLSLLATGSSVSANRNGHHEAPPTGGRVISEIIVIGEHSLGMGQKINGEEGRKPDGDPFDNYLTPDEWWQTRVIQPCFVWSVNIFVVICVLTRLLVYGEPVQDFKSRSWRVFLSLRARAREEAGVGNVREAQRQYIECLQILERPLPSAGVDQALSVVWQIIRHALNSLWIGRWFSRRKRDAGKPVTVVCKSHAHTAMVYHKMHQVNGLLWVFHPLSREFLSDVEAVRTVLSAKKSSLTPIIGECDGDVLSRLRAAFKLRLLILLANELSGEDSAKEIDVVDVSRLLVSISMANGLPKKENNWDCATTLTEGDAMCTWWTHVFTCALFWKQGMREKAKQHYAVVRRCPPELLNNPLALALGHAFCCRKLCIDDRDNVNFGKFVFVHSRKALEQLRMACARDGAPEVSELQILALSIKVSGRVTYTRAQQPDPFHLHVLCKLHDDIPRMCERVK